MKVLLVCSSGGHLAHLNLIKDIFEKNQRVWVTFDKPDANSLLENEKKYYCYFPTNRNIINLLKNTLLAMKILIKEKPDLVISSGAAIAIPFFYVAKLRKIKTIYIEVFDRIDSPTITGLLVKPVSDVMIVQWEEMKKVYKKAKNLGGIY